MQDTVIHVEGLGKKYRLGKTERYKSLRESLTNAAAAPFRRLRSGANGDAASQILWALSDVSFSVNRGEVLGVIGRNGAGKSTLLKILSRITEPTTGRIRLRGRVGSLLEVGTGFHPELSGRENIFMNGAILGMPQEEIRRKFDDIVAFAEVDRFIDTPVKRYSSGMYMRLAFAVAAHLEPEILVVDEVLAVGDAQFQKKCIGKMGDVARHGRTVLFVSHNIGAINALCTRCIMLTAGRLTHDGSPAEVTAAYQSAGQSATRNALSLDNPERFGNGKARFTSLSMTPAGAGSEGKSYLHPGQDLIVEATIHAHQEITDAGVDLIIFDSTGYRLIDAGSAKKGTLLSLAAGRETTLRWILSHLLLRPDTYTVGLWVGRTSMEDIDGIHSAGTFVVEPIAESLRSGVAYRAPYDARFSYEIL